MYDRAMTIKALADPNTKPTDLARPGHVNPLRARNRGCLLYTSVESLQDLEGATSYGSRYECWKELNTRVR